jgi:hypothetical protein
MKKNIWEKKSWIIGIILFTTVFFASAIIFNIFDIEILPSQFFGALIGVVITAIITVLLLQGQTANEEAKEKNVKVFEEKTIRYNAFIEELWNIWEDRIVNLEELNSIMKLFCKDIILFTSSTNTQIIIARINEIAEYAVKGADDNESKVKIQNCIFDIIKVLSADLELGGDITKITREQLIKLESKIDNLFKVEKEKKRIADLQKEYKKEIIDIVVKKLPIQKYKIEHWPDGGDKDSSEYLWFHIKNSNVWIVVGPFIKAPESSRKPFISFYSYFWENRHLDQYRFSKKGVWKDLFKGDREIFNIVDFSDNNTVENYEESSLITDKQGKNDTKETKAEALALEIINFFETWKIDGKDIMTIINEHKS